MNTIISPKARRNELQRARRADPEQKAIEAAASRVTYWRKRYFAAPLGDDVREHDRLTAAQEGLAQARGSA
jgi:hypothetical protein